MAKSWPGNDPHVYLTSVISAGIEGSIMPAWSRENGGPLTEQSIADVSAYILTLPPGEQLPTQGLAPEGPLGVSASLVIFGGLALLVVAALVLYYRWA